MRRVARRLVVVGAAVLAVAALASPASAWEGGKIHDANLTSPAAFHLDFSAPSSLRSLTVWAQMDSCANVSEMGTMTVHAMPNAGDILGSAWGSGTEAGTAYRLGSSAAIGGAPHAAVRYNGGSCFLYYPWAALGARHFHMRFDTTGTTTHRIRVWVAGEEVVSTVAIAGTVPVSGSVGVEGTVPVTCEECAGGGGAGGEVALAEGDAARLDLSWIGLWALLGLACSAYVGRQFVGEMRRWSGGWR